MKADDCVSDRYIVGRLGGCAPLPVFALDRLPLYAAASALQQIGRAALYGREYYAVSSAKHGGVEVRKTGLRILRSWPGAFDDLLDKLVAQRDVSKRGARVAMTAMYGDLYRWLYASQIPEFDLFRNAFKSHAAQRVTWNNSLTAFGGTLETHTTTLGTIIDHCGSPFVKTYLFAMHLGYIDASQPIMRAHPVPRSALDKIQAMLQDEIYRLDAASYLGIDTYRLKKLCDRRMIEVISLKAQGSRLNVLLRSNLDGFLDKLSRDAPDVEEPPEAAKTILKAAKKLNLDSLELIQLIFDGKIQVIARQRSLRGLLSLFVDLEDVLKLRQAAPNLYTLKHAAKQFGQTYDAMQLLTSEGAIPSIPNPSTRQHSRLVTREDCQKFFQEYASVGELAARSGQSPNTLVRVLTQMAVEPRSIGSRSKLFYARSSAEIALSKWDWTVDLQARRLKSQRLKAEERLRAKSHLDRIEIPSKIRLMSRDQAKIFLQSHFQYRFVHIPCADTGGLQIKAILKSKDGIHRVAYEVFMNSRLLPSERAIQLLYLIHASAGKMSIRQMLGTVGGCQKAASALYRYILNDVGLEAASNIIASIIVDPTVLPTAGDPMIEPQETTRAACLWSSEPQ
ncbi:hypothetical protein [Microvirga sesbaniae]|uniref:hypothetical protein n=1 Tax=Microvirga sesbaniae TaxID=681392 RepID=UPI0021C9F03B|nr:hypothetical protein [Microvirga sp. HBU67692]